ncbi:MAG: molybdenum cofactor biosynthesis protein MoaE [Verrucomicrobiota bacterium]
MEIEIQLTDQPIAGKISSPVSAGGQGAWLEFRGIVRGEENAQAILALEYEAYPEMAVREMRRILESLASRHACLAVKIIHRIGVIPVGETAIYAGVASRHRAEALAMLTGFMDRLKQDVPIWKLRAIFAKASDPMAHTGKPTTVEARSHQKRLSLDEALSEIELYCQSLPPVRIPLEEALGRVLRETIYAEEDSPDCDRSTRDGYAILQNDSAGIFQVVDTLHAADWKPRELKPSETVRVATGASLPCENLRVVMQEDVERNGDQIKVLHRDDALNIRKRGEEIQAGRPVLHTGKKLHAGTLVLLASLGITQPPANPRIQVVHFTTGDEVVAPDQKPRPGQIRDSNSILIRSLLQKFPVELFQRHLPEDLARAQAKADKLKSRIENANVLLVSGGASVGDKDFTRVLLSRLGFKIIFNRLSIRPGAPLIFGVQENGVQGNRIAFGLPGNPLSHFVCFHVFVAAALAKLAAEAPEKFQAGRLAVNLEDGTSPRETLWPARLNSEGLHPLPWTSSGDITCLAEANALVRVPANRGPLCAGEEIQFLPT